jgi:hypothetical protein
VTSPRLTVSSAMCDVERRAVAAHSAVAGRE